jgi:phosphoribosylamine--glycine ligase
MFTRHLLKKYDVPGNIEFSTFSSMDGLDDYIDVLGLDRVVVKPDGLTGGKGVKVFGDHLHSREDVLGYCDEIFSKGGHLVIEEKLDGEEFTLQTFVDGKTILPTPIVQDHKRAFENDEGPNTGGMGSYSMQDHLMPFLTSEDVESALACMRGSIEALKADMGCEYKGFLYGQFMKTRQGVKLIEFNVRFGDPEAMNVLPILDTNFVDICQAIIDGTLDAIKAEFLPKATVVKYMVPSGYPDAPAEKESIEIDEAGLEQAGARYYFASVNQDVDGSILTSSSRSIGVLGIADTIEDAEGIAENGTAFVNGNLFHRKDIATSALLQKRIDHMTSVMEEN